MRKKTMQNIVIVTSKEKQELSTEKVELSASGDMKKIAGKMEPLMKKGQTHIQKIEAVGKEIAKNISGAKTILVQAEKIQQEGYTLLDQTDEVLAKVENAVKELGVKPETIEGYAELKKLRSTAYYDFKGLADAYWENINGMDGDLAALKNISPL